MTEISVYASFGAGLVLGLWAGISPGPLLAVVVSESLRRGARAGVKAALAPLATDVPIIVVSLWVLNGLASSGRVLGVITLAGGLFVLYLAYESLRSRGLETETGTRDDGRAFLRGTVVNALSPHPYLFWLTVGGPFVVKAWTASRWAAGAFLVGFYACLVGSKVIVAVSVGASRGMLTGKAYVYVVRFLGAALFAFAVLLLWNGLHLLGVMPAW